MAYFLVILGAALRLVPHPANFTPLTAIGLFGGATLGKKTALWIPLAALVVSDFFIGFDSFASRSSVYGSFLIITLLGFVVGKKITPLRVIGGAVAGSVIFYVITNLVVLYPPVMYPHTLAGQMASYAAALPFLRNMMLGDLVYTGLLFGLHAWVAQRTEKVLKIA